MHMMMILMNIHYNETVYKPRNVKDTHKFTKLI